MLGLLFELVSDLDSNNTEMPRIRHADIVSHLEEWTVVYQCFIKCLQVRAHKLPLYDYSFLWKNITLKTEICLRFYSFFKLI